MKLFAELYFALDTTSNPEVKVRALSHYIRHAPPEDAMWALGFLLGKKPTRILAPDESIELALQTAQTPRWLFEASLTAVKDRFETAVLLLPQSGKIEERPLHEWLETVFPALRCQNIQTRNAKICASWNQMDVQQRFVWNKLLSGGFRLQLPETLIVKALNAVSGLEPYVLAYRLSRLARKWETTREACHALLHRDPGDAVVSRPYHFSSQQILDRTSDAPADVRDWHVEWNWDGLRVQCVKRQGQFFLWSQETELLTEKFPELYEAGLDLPDGTVIEALIAGWRGDLPLAAETLQARIRRKHLTKKLLQETPFRVFAVDLLEYEREDIRRHPFSVRRKNLATLLKERSGSPFFHISPDVQADCWNELDAIAGQARKKGAIGLMLSPLGASEEEGAAPGWWTWKARPFTLLGVLIYVQRRQGQSMTSVNEYSVGVWEGERLVKVATAEATLPESEQEEIGRFVKENTLERFGPVRSVRAKLVFEISFGSIRKSPRHKAGLKLDNPRIVRWHREKTPADADTLATLQDFLCQGTRN